MKIAYITERDIESSRISGAIIKDIRLLQVLRTFSQVNVFFNNPMIFNKHSFLFNNKRVNTPLFSQIDHEMYDIVIISAMVVSPFLLGYQKIKTKKIYYFADSQFHERKQKLTLKYSILINMLAIQEEKILKRNYCAYLGIDEIKYIPNKYLPHCFIFPFSITLNNKIFVNEGKLIIVGQYSYQPNLKMLQKVNDIAEMINYPIYIYGQNIPNLKYKKNMIVVGYAETLEEIYSGARALLYSIDYGVGIKNKVLEAMSYGIPTIGYKEAFTNLELIDKESCIVVDSNSALVNAANYFDLAAVSEKAHKVAQDKYSLTVISKEIKRNILSLL